ncbi:sensor histidine kinase [Paenibacillus planticolens]|uniref:sensor histidine kinase n=1 Tax=Paenibacillus planticolens TaxID=2654976 RepID=UPI001491835B|nr:HAMP domain-containing sensor histidine kinase [Paenibacillus planticolens]
MLPLSLTAIIIFAGFIPAAMTWICFNIGCFLVLNYYWQPALLSSAFILVGSYFVRHKTNQMKLKIKLCYAAGLLSIYEILYALLATHTQTYFSLYVLYTILFTFISLLVLIIVIFHVMRHEFIRERLVALEKDRMVGQLAATISHEIRNPLTSIRGFLQLLDQKELSMYDQKRYIELALSGVDQANTIINDYLNYAKPSTGLQEQLDIKKELEATLRFISPYASDHQVVIEITHDNEIPLYILGESKKLRQCLMNLVKNAIESMPNGGLISMRTCKLPGAVQILITDTGVGMTKEQIDSLGMPFFTTKEQGTGLGLVVVMSIIKMMNGTISFSSSLNQGTECSILFQQK